MRADGRRPVLHDAQPEALQSLDDLSEAQVAELLSQKLGQANRNDREGGP